MRDFQHIEAIVVHRSEGGHTGAEMKVNAPHAYNFFIRKDGTIDVLYWFDVRCEHAKDWNSRTIAVALYGYFCPRPPQMDARAHLLNQDPTPAQLESLRTVIECSRWWLGKHLAVVGHSELGPSGTDYPEKLIPATSCPGPRLDLTPFR